MSRRLCWREIWSVRSKLAQTKFCEWCSHRRRDDHKTTVALVPLAIALQLSLLEAMPTVLVLFFLLVCWVFIAVILGTFAVDGTKLQSTYVQKLQAVEEAVTHPRARASRRACCTRDKWKSRAAHRLRLIAAGAGDV